MRRCELLALAVGVLAFAGAAYALLTMEIGPDSVRRHPTVEQPSWPAGLVALPRHKSRTFSINEGGDIFYFNASPSEIQELILLFSKTRMRDHELRVKPREDQQLRLKDDRFEYNMSLNVPGSFSRLVGGQPEPSTYEPVLTLHIELPDDRGLAEELKLPDNIIVRSELENLPLKGKAVRPKREWWYSKVRFENTAADNLLQDHVIIKVTLWERDEERGIPLGTVDYKAVFTIALSEQEMADLKSGKTWLTLTPGNWSSKEKSDDPKLGVDKLSRQKETAGQVTVAQPPFYYGRLLFEDGGIVSSRSYMTRDVTVFFHVGMARVDSDGYFRVCFTDDQLEEAQEREGHKNVYIPSDRNWNGATAGFEFPASKLSTDKNKAGVIRIPRPPASVPAE